MPIKEINESQIIQKRNNLKRVLIGRVAKLYETGYSVEEIAMKLHQPSDLIEGIIDMVETAIKIKSGIDESE